MATKTKTQENSRPAVRMIKTSHDLPKETREEMVQLLNQQLADTFDLFSQTKQAHWNVKGPEFYQLHELYDELAGELLGYVDMIAERATALGGAATGTVRMAAQASRLPEFKDSPVGSRESVQLLVERYAGLAQSTRQGIDTADEAGDADTADLLTEVSRGLDKSLWFLEAHIQQGE
ncbi:MAG: DNA starvation/stationary phase protection protein Dps [Anaerolineae bacterium]|nr:DNA starvation/stationary phase protection protein Dps [Anaerolineae bacterium]